MTMVTDVQEEEVNGVCLDQYGIFLPNKAALYEAIRSLEYDSGWKFRAIQIIRLLVGPICCPSPFHPQLQTDPH